MFEPVDPEPYRWMGAALTSGVMPERGCTQQRVDALKRVLDLPHSATDAEINDELAAFMKHGKRRT